MKPENFDFQEIQKHCVSELSMLLLDSEIQNLAELLTVDHVIDASASKFGSFHEKVSHGIKAIATCWKRRYQDIDEAT